MGINPIGFNIADLIGKTDDPYAVKGTQDSLDKQAFLKLLTTQLQHQNPLEPMDNQQFVSQMAEFSALEQMQNLNKNFAAMALMQASTILGKYVEAAPLGGGNSGDLIGGIVSSIRMGEDGQMFLLVDGREIDASLVKTISESSATNTLETEMFLLCFPFGTLDNEGDFACSTDLCAFTSLVRTAIYYDNPTFPFLMC